ncbi:MAG: hypothetical protein JO225_17465 [Candidatus Eremiobacteraeota bacterium]|nr:hypothetical protein [Candidatus Eremiobacteraeota bacterium]
MSSRASAFAVAAVAIALVLAQYAFPAAPLYHTWQYALALALALVPMLGYANAALRGRDGILGRRFALAIAGAILIDLSGMASGLLGPDTATIAGTPGTVMPVPALGAAAFFAPADAQTIERGTATVTLRRRGASEIALAGEGRRLLGESTLYLTPRPAAYIEVSDPAGAHLTMTQPTSAAFLSPVLLFHDRQKIGDVTVPLDTFAVPARGRVFRALYFTAADFARFHRAAPGAAGAALVLTAADDRGRPLGITLAPSGTEVVLAGARIRAELGRYPALAVAAAPEPWVLLAGGAFLIGGLAWAAAGYAMLTRCAVSPLRL